MTTNNDDSHPFGDESDDRGPLPVETLVSIAANTEASLAEDDWDGWSYGSAIVIGELEDYPEMRPAYLEALQGTAWPLRWEQAVIQARRAELAKDPAKFVSLVAGPSPTYSKAFLDLMMRSPTAPIVLVSPPGTFFELSPGAFELSPDALADLSTRVDAAMGGIVAAAESIELASREALAGFEIFVSEIRALGRAHGDALPSLEPDFARFESRRLRLGILLALLGHRA